MCITCGCGSDSVLVGGKRHRRGGAAGVVSYRALGGAKAGKEVAAAAPGESAESASSTSVTTTAVPAAAGSATVDLAAVANPTPSQHLHFAHPSGTPHERVIQVERDLLAKNDALAMANRKQFAARRMLALNLVSSPGSGKTTLLVETLKALNAAEPSQPQPGARATIAVIEGDQQTDNDAKRIRATGVPAVQINTGKGCHLDADMVGHAMAQLDLADGALLFIENVGNLVCPAAFDLGEAAKVVVLSVTEGEDKPLKYPDMFRAARLMLLNKCDLLPYVQFDVAQALANARRVNPEIEIIQLSASSGVGMEAWLEWIARHRKLA